VTPLRFSIATYNIHKCRGIDTRMRPVRIAEVIRKLDADIVALQEVVRGRGEEDQLTVLGHHLPGYKSCFGETRKIGTAAYGDAQDRDRGVWKRDPQPLSHQRPRTLQPDRQLA
jgi:endonuclease/exonuclease/phosphatase family metal-dependent hydrolase